MIELNVLLSPTRPYFARYEGTDSKGRAAFIEFELGQTDGWFKRYGVLGFPASREEHIGVDDRDVKQQIEAAIANGYHMVADEGTSMVGVNKQMLGFTDWLRSR